MNLLHLIEFLRRHLKGVILGCYAVLALVVLADIVRVLTAHGHEAPAATAGAAHGFWASLFHVAETVPGFWTVFGFLGCVLLVIVSKALLAPCVSRKENSPDE